jgi:NAD(P) transhydrogenase subunit alpha
LRLQKLGFEVAVETGAGREIDCFDSTYKEAGATIVEDARELWASSDVIKVRPPEQHPALGVHETDFCAKAAGSSDSSGRRRIKNCSIVSRRRKATVFAMDSVPRITRAQKMDALSAMANIAGYRAVIEAANHFSRFFGGQMTAAGRVEPAKVLVIGAGVAGLSAIGTARSAWAQSSRLSTRVRRRAIRSKVWARNFSNQCRRRRRRQRRLRERNERRVFAGGNGAVRAAGDGS